MSLESRRLQLAEAPALLVSSGPAELAARRGAVLLYHGLSAAKEVNQPELEDLARQGLLAVGIDCVGHGERRYRDFESRFGAGGEETKQRFLEVVRETNAELPRVVDALLERGLGRVRRIGIVGISLGGFIAYGAPLVEDRLGLVAPILGNPEWGDDPASPHLNPERFAPLPLISQHAGRDDVVPPDPARRFHRRLEPHYAASPERLRYIEYPESGHMMAAKDWQACWGTTLEWCQRYLGAG